MWSPDGRKIVFVRFRRCVRHERGRKRGAEPHAERHVPLATDSAPAWSPDGRKILFVSNRGGNGEVYVMNADGSGLRKLTRLKGGD